MQSGDKTMCGDEAKFGPGDVVCHRKFDYRGVVVDVDPVYLGTDEWYDTMARSMPPRDAPWYRVLVHGAEHTTYVAERHLAPDETGRPIVHPLIEETFTTFDGQRYAMRQNVN